MKKLILIGGPGRSGTSLVTNVMGAMGIGLSRKLKASDPANARGYFEDETILALHKDLLGSMGAEGTFGSMVPPPEDWTSRPNVLTAREKIVTHVAKEMNGKDVLAVKDPRTSVLLPMWVVICQQLELELVPVMSLRSPTTVAESISRISKVPPSVGFSIWMNRVCHFIRDAPGSFWLVHYEQLLAEPASVVRDLAPLCGRGVDVATTVQRVLDAQVVQPSLQTSLSNSEVHGHAAAKRLYDELKGISGFCSETGRFEEMTERYFRSCTQQRGWIAGILQLQKTLLAERRKRALLLAEMSDGSF